MAKNPQFVDHLRHPKVPLRNPHLPHFCLFLAFYNTECHICTSKTRFLPLPPPPQLIFYPFYSLIPYNPSLLLIYESWGLLDLRL